MVDKTALAKNGKSYSELRDATEKKLGNSPDVAQEFKEKSLEEIIHELQVHQVELETQNEELKRVQLELEATRNKYQDLYDFAPVGYFTLTQKGIITQVNLTGAALLGMPGSKLIGRGFGHFVAPQSLDQWDQHIISVLGHEERKTCDLRLKREDNSSFYARLDGIRMDALIKQTDRSEGYHVVRMAVIDISEHRRLEEAIKQSEEMFRTVADFTYDWEYWIDPDGSLIYISPSCERITGYRSDEFINNPGLLKDIIHPEDQLLVGNHFDSIDSAPPYAVEFRIVSPAGETRWIGHRCQAVYGDDGRFLGRRVSNRDITKLKEIEEVVKQRTEELESRNKDLEQFAYVASHDLQEPLRMVSSYMGLIEGRYKGRLDADADEFIGYAVDGAKRMRMLINDLLEYSRVGTHGKPFGPVDCETLLNRSLDHLQLMIEDSGATVTHDHLPTVIGDGAQLMRLFQNLINNSLKFRKDASPLIHVSAEPCDGDWLFSVHDNGIGIDPQYADRIFVIFQRLHDREEYPGTGIGLAICKKIVERHGGRIRVQSEQDKGATFIFTIPRQDSKS